MKRGIKFLQSLHYQVSDDIGFIADVTTILTNSFVDDIFSMSHSGVPH